LGAADRIVMNRDHLIGEAKKEVLKMADDGYAPPIKKKIRCSAARPTGWSGPR
jgi:3-hydroxyacyl-CoA dehydrogenase